MAIMEPKDLVETQKYKNYLHGSLALSYVGRQLKPYTVDILKQIHHAIASSLPAGLVRTCTEADPCSKRKHFTVNSWCSSCKEWRKLLVKYHRYEGSIKWKDQDSWQWPKSYTAIVGIFLHMPVPVKFGDVSCSRQIWLSCEECFKTEDKESMKRLLERVGKCRNALIAHNTELQLTEREKSDIFDTLKDLLKVVEKVMGKRNVDKCLEWLDKIDDLTMSTLANIKESLEKSTENQYITLEVLKGLTELVVFDVTERLNKIQDDLVKAKESMAVLIVMIQELRSLLLRFYSQANRIYKAVKVALSLFWTIVPILLLVVMLFIGDGDRSRLSNEGDDQIARFSPGSIRNSRIDISGCLSEGHFVPVPLLSYLLMHRTKKIIGRGWVFQILEERVLQRNTSSRGVLVIAHFGFGKSAIAAQLICARENEVGWNLRKHVVAFHVCKYESDDTKNPLQFIKRLMSFLHMKSKEYRRYLYKQNDSIINDDVKCEANILYCFDIAIKNPLDFLPVPDDAPWIVVIDALDECVYNNDHGQNRILELLSDRLIHLQQQVPRWFKFIATSRHSLQTLENLEAVHLASNSESNYNDIRLFILEVLNISFEDSPVVEDLVKHSEGNFLYTTVALEYLKKSRSLSQGNIDKLPKQMEDIYELNFDRLFSRNNDFNVAKRIFQLMGVKRFLNNEFLIFLEMSNVTNATQFESIMNKLSSFLVSDFYVTFRHKSLYEWLISENNKRYSISLREGHRMVSNYLLILFRELSETEIYSIQYRNARYVDRIFLDLAYHASETNDKDIQNKFLSLHINTSTLIQELHLIISSSDSRRIKMFKLLIDMCHKLRFKDDRYSLMLGYI